jgi:hypothetical protein
MAANFLAITQRLWFANRTRKVTYHYLQISKKMKERDKMKAKLHTTITMTITLSLCLGSQAIAQDEKPFYRGGIR